MIKKDYVATETYYRYCIKSDHIFLGLGELLAAHANYPAPVEMIGIMDTFGESGTPEELAEKYGLTARHIVEASQKVLKRKPSLP